MEQKPVEAPKKEQPNTKKEPPKKKLGYLVKPWKK